MAACARPVHPPGGQPLSARLDDYAQSDGAGQERWLVDLLRQRSELACRLTMSREQLEAQRARHAAVLARVRAGGRPSAAGLVRLLQEVDAQENAAIDKLSREYQAAVQRGDRGAADAIDSWQDIHDRWLQAGRPWEQQPKLIHWLRTANAQATSEHRTNRPTDKPVRSAVPSSKNRTAPTVDPNELSARIASYNLQLASLLSRLHGQSTWSPQQLDAITGPLADLALLRTDLNLWWEVLPSESQSHIKRPQPIEPAVALVAARTAAVRRELESVAGADHTRELQILDRVSLRLALLAVEP